METSDISTCEIHNISGDFVCSCGQTHTSLTKNIFVGGDTLPRFIDCVKSLAPSCGAVLMICDTAVFESLGAGVERSLRRGGFMVKRQLIGVVNGDNLPSEKCSRPPETVEILPDEGIRLVISVGGGCAADTAKLAAFKADLPIAVLASSPSTCSYLMPYAAIIEDGFYVRHRAAIPSALAYFYGEKEAAPSQLVACGFGEIMSRLLSLFDYRFYCIIGGIKHCQKLAEQIQEVIYTLLTALKGLTRGDSSALRLIAAAEVRLGAIGQMLGEEQLFGGADCALTACLSMLYSAENRHIKLGGENAFLLSRILVKVYRSVLESGLKGFVPPPDNNLRINKISEYLGVTAAAAAKHVLSYPVGKEFRLQMYRLNEYRDELSGMIAEIDLIFDEGFKLFKRLYDDDGYSLSGYLDEADARIILTLSPDVYRHNGMLTFLKNVGILDRYL